MNNSHNLDRPASGKGSVASKSPAKQDIDGKEMKMDVDVAVGTNNMADSKLSKSGRNMPDSEKEYGSKLLDENETVVNNVDAKREVSGDHETLSRGNPIAEFLQLQKGNIKGLSQEEFMSKYETFVKEMGDGKGGSSSAGAVTSDGAVTTQEHNQKVDAVENSKIDGNDDDNMSSGSDRNSIFYIGENNFTKIVLKFTTLSEGCQEAPSFTVDKKGAIIGSSESNSISIPSDQRLAAENHSMIEYHRGAFYIIDGGYSFAASIRIGVGSTHNKKWYIDKGARFSAGNSVFQSKGPDADGNLLITVAEGPMQGEELVITPKGATFGRSSDNTISVPDRELSRRHSKIEYDEANKRYLVNDMGSTNGTYVQIVGPYGGKYKLNLNDHILVGRTGFSINRFDYGLSEEIGYRQSMEDACAIVQHLNIGPLCMRDLSPQSFFGVFDGHGGSQASHYLAQHLHINVAHGLLSISDEIFQIFDEIAPKSIFSDPAAVKAMDTSVIKSLKSVFLQTDADFISSSANPGHGSTATTALLLGKRLYCANVGDSRTMICRNFQPIVMSEDHRPTREDESKRIREAGGFVINNRVMGELAVSRAFGDVEFKKGIQSILKEEENESGAKRDGSSGIDGDGDNSSWDQPLIIAEPDVQTITMGDHDQFLLLACDGLFDVYTPEEVVKFVKEAMERHGDTQRCCQSLTHDAIKKRNSRDNVSVILIILHKWY